MISIHPEHIGKIIAGTKRLEFRRSWASQPVDRIIFYVTAPVGRIAAVAGVKRTLTGSRSFLWEMAKLLGGGISRRRLFCYLKGKRSAVALELCSVSEFPTGVEPHVLFGKGFRPPQSFRYLREAEDVQLNRIVQRKWEYSS